MKKIYFLRTAPYEYILKGLDLYDSFDAVATRKVDVPINKIVEPSLFPSMIKDANFIFCSSAKRSVQTAKLISSNPEILPELQEVYYTMENFIRKEDFYDADGKSHVTKARKAFVKALINNKLKEPYNAVVKRVENVLDMTNYHYDCVVFSHGFFLKILEAYIKDPSIKYRPERLLYYLSGETETFHFCEGFVIESEGNRYHFKDYVKGLSI